MRAPIFLFGMMFECWGGKLGFVGEDVTETLVTGARGGIYTPRTPRKGSRHIARAKIIKIPTFLTSRDMAGAFLGGVGGIDSPHALVSELSVTSSPTNQNLNFPKMIYIPQKMCYNNLNAPSKGDFS